MSRPSVPVGSFPPRRWVVPGLCCALLLAGCSGWPGGSSKPAPPLPPPPRDVVGDQRLPTTLRRVALLPIWAGEVAPAESAAALDAVFVTALERQMRFEVVPVTREDFRRRYGVEALSSASALPYGFLTDLAKDFAVQGVIFVDLTTYRPFRPLGLGIRAKLGLVADGHLAWACDELFLASNPSVVEGIRRYYAGASGQKGGIPINMPEAALMSPTRFADYAADAIFRTLPPR